MSKLYALPLTLALTALSACGGNSGKSFEDLIVDGLAIENRTLGLDYTDPTTLPTSGTAVYNGVIIGTVANTDPVAGDLRLEVNFGDDDDFVTGRATNFVNLSDERLSGQLDISNGEVDRGADTNVDYTFVADLTGELTDSEDSYAVDAFIRGDFLGTDRAFAAGEVFGDVTTASTGTISAVDGVFTTED